MVKIICVNDKNRPKEIPQSDWIKEGETYHITHVSIQVNQIENGKPVLGCDLYEKPLSIEKHYPYECFKLWRFATDEENTKALIELIQDCYNLPKDNVLKLIEESELSKIETL
jgi:hypothetical protein